MDGRRGESWQEAVGDCKENMGGEGFPDEWRIGVVVPIWKKEDKKRPGNYRGVTLTGTGYKIYASILNRKIVRELDEKGGWSRSQAGFRKGRGT